MRTALKNLGIVLTSWIIYVLFYLSRLNFSIAFPHAIGELSLSYTAMGVISGLFSLSYSLGQVVSGYFAAVGSPWTLLLVGAILSGLVNVLFGCLDSLEWFTVMWSLNGLFQSVAWVSLVEILAIALEERGLGRYMGLFNTSWALGVSITWIVTGFVVTTLGWRFGFVLNGMLTATLGCLSVAMLRRLVGPHMGDYLSRMRVRNRVVWRDLSRYLVPIVLIASAYFLSTGIRRVLELYIPSYLSTVINSSLSSTLVAALYPLAGAVGMVLYGYVLDRYHGMDKVKPLLLSILLAALLTYSLTTPATYGHIQVVVELLAMGTLSYGIDAHLATTIPSLAVNKDFLPISIGIINAVGHLGAFTFSVLGGYLVDHYGFNAAFLSCSIGATLLIPPLAMLRNTKIRR